MTNELVSCECAQLREKLAVAEAKIEALIAVEAERQSDTARLEILESLIEECGDKEITIVRRRDGKIWITAERHFAALGACSSGETLSAAIDAAQSAKESANG